MELRPHIDTAVKWIDSRTRMVGTIEKTLRKPIPGGAGYLFSLGALNGFLFLNQFITGTLLMMYYAPTPDHAYEAVRYIQNDVAFGYMIRGLHFWGATCMIVSVILHTLRVFVFGAYKKPREIMWLTGVVMFLLVFGFAFTGYLLPWDQKAYWATVVGTSVAGTAPVAGGVMVRIMRGGADITALTLTRFFTLHTMILPWTLAAFVGMHVTILQLVGHGGPWDPRKMAISRPFFPNQVFKDMLLCLGVMATMMFLATVAPAGLEAIADPTDNSYNPRPEWYFYFLFQMLKYFEGPFEVIGTMVLPNIALMVLFAVPFIDRSDERNPLKRPKAMAGAGAALSVYVLLTILAALSPPAGASQEAVTGPPPKSVTEGRQLYADSGCASCHSIKGVGGMVAPPLDGVGSRRDYAWLLGHFKDPQAFTPGSVMPAYAHLPEADLEKLTDYMMSLK